MKVTDQSLEVCEIMELISISHGSVFSIFGFHFGITLSADWVPHFAHNRAQTKSCDNFEEYSSVVQPLSVRPSQ